jgi:hypothetical protein
MITGFFTSAENDRNKYIYFIDFSEWLKYVNYVAHDDIVSESFKREENKYKKSRYVEYEPYLKNRRNIGVLLKLKFMGYRIGINILRIGIDYLE